MSSRHLATVVSIMLWLVLPTCFGDSKRVLKAQQNATPANPPSFQLLLKFEEAQKIACAKIKELNPRSLVQGALAPSYSSRESPLPTGTLVAFTIRGSHRTEKLGELEDKVVVIFPDDPKAAITARKVTVWMDQGLLGVTR